MNDTEYKVHPDPAINAEVNADIKAAQEADAAAGLSPEKVEELTPTLVEMFYKTWTPTSENINLLPEPLRRFIHDIETKCDPAGDAAKIILQSDTINAQALRITELEKACDSFESNSLEAAEVSELLMRHNLIPAEKQGPGLRLAAVIADVVYLSEKVHTMLGRFPGSDLCKAAEVRINEYKGMETKYEAMKLDVEGLRETVAQLMATKEMEAPGVAQMIGAAIILREMPDNFRKPYQAIVRNLQRLEEKLDGMKSDYNRAILAIKNHQSQKGDDRCWLDDATLYQESGVALGSDSNTALPPREEFLANCARFHASRQHPADRYITVEKRIHDAIETARGEWHTQFGEELRVEKDAAKQKTKEVKRLDLIITRTRNNLKAAIERQRKIGGREAGSLMAKYVIPAAKRLGWAPTIKEKARGKTTSRVRGR